MLRTSQTIIDSHFVSHSVTKEETFLQLFVPTYVLLFDRRKYLLVFTDTSQKKQISG